MTFTWWIKTVISCAVGAVVAGAIAFAMSSAVWMLVAAIVGPTVLWFVLGGCAAVVLGVFGYAVADEYERAAGPAPGISRVPPGKGR